MLDGRSVRVTDTLNFQNLPKALLQLFPASMMCATNTVLTQAATRRKNKQTNKIHRKKIFARVYSKAKIFGLCLFNSSAQGYVT